MKKVLLSGIQASGDLHMGNYFGAMKQNIEISNKSEYDSYVMIADYHALTTLHSKESAEKLRRSTLQVAAAYIACGLNPMNIFKQSLVPEHTELSTILSNLVTMPYMMRAHAFKDHEAKDKDVNVGLFNYPILMAADILLYNTDLVPVGQDQKQHIEYARDIAGYFNRAYNVEYFKLPADHIVKEVGIIPGTDGEKMSKSKGNVVPIFGDDESVRKSIMSIVTDSARPEDKKDPDTNNIYNIHKVFLDEDEDFKLREKFIAGGYSYKEAKEDLLQTVTDWRKGKIEKYNELMSKPELLEEILQKGSNRAREVAQARMEEIKRIVGLS